VELVLELGGSRERRWEESNQLEVLHCYIPLQHCREDWSLQGPLVSSLEMIHMSCTEDQPPLGVQGLPQLEVEEQGLVPQRPGGGGSTVLGGRETSYII